MQYLNKQLLIRLAIITLMIVVSVITASSLTGCSPQSETTDRADAQELVDSFVYVKAKDGLCFGVATTSRVSTNISVAMNNVVVLVECNKVGF